MSIHHNPRALVALTILGAVAVFAVGFFVALGIRSVVAGPDAAPSAAAPNPGHDWDSAGYTLTGSHVLTEGSWTTRASMPTSRNDLAAVAVNNKIYAIGGSNAPYLATVEEYDPATDTWTPRASMPTARLGLAAAAVNNKVYAIGGYDVSYLATVEEYDPSTDTWTTMASMPTARRMLAAAVVNNKVYAIGGSNGSALALVEEYDPATDTWTTMASMPTARIQFGAVAVNNKIYAIGGYNGFSVLTTVEEYDPATDTWTTKAGMPTARGWLRAAAVNNKIYAIGGYNGLYLTTVEEYDPATDTWTTRASMPTARDTLAAAVVNNKIYAIGGYSGVSYLATVEEYLPPVPSANLLSCDVKASCGVGEIAVLRMSSTSNAHAGTPSGSSYGNVVCCTEISGLGTECTGIYDVVLTLSGADNAHVASDGGYATEVCLSGGDDATIDCTYGASCAVDYACLATISGSTNAHVADCDGVDDYATKVCCKATEDNCPTDSNPGQENYDGDTWGDACDPDDDNDTVLDGDDLDPLDEFACQDLDADTCDDCSVLGVAAPSDDGTDTDADGLCNAGDPDDDNDGLGDGIDSDPLVVSTVFSDVSLGGTTFGEILDSDGLTIEVTEEPNPEGVRIVVSGGGGPATVSVCGIVTLYLGVGDDAVVTCGSATVEVFVGPVTAIFGLFGAILPASTTATIEELTPGVFRVENSPGSAASIMVNGIEIPPGGSETDDDGDGFFTSTEQLVGTDPLDSCPDVVSSMCGSDPQYPCCPGPECDGDDALPPDPNVDRTVNITDVLLYKPALGGPYDSRYDLDASGVVNILDVLMYKPVLGTSCTNP